MVRFSYLMAVYTPGDFTLIEVSPTLFRVSSEDGSLAYFASRLRAEQQGHETAKERGVTLWRGIEGKPQARTLIASYRPS